MQIPLNYHCQTGFNLSVLNVQSINETTSIHQLPAEPQDVIFSSTYNEANNDNFLYHTS